MTALLGYCPPGCRCGGSTRARVKLRDVENRKLVVFNELHGELKIGLTFIVKAGNYVGGDGNSGHMLCQIVADTAKLLNDILASHSIQNLVTGRLHGNVKKSMPAMLHTTETIALDKEPSNSRKVERLHGPGSGSERDFFTPDDTLAPPSSSPILRQSPMSLFTAVEAPKHFFAPTSFSHSNHGKLHCVCASSVIGGSRRFWGAS